MFASRSSVHVEGKIPPPEARVAAILAHLIEREIKLLAKLFVRAREDDMHAAAQSIID
jgi:hypothetical protein